MMTLREFSNRIKLELSNRFIGNVELIENDPVEYYCRVYIKDFVYQLNLTIGYYSMVYHYGYDDEFELKKYIIELIIEIENAYLDRTIRKK